ncbi:YaaC family protein [Streptomyces nigra]
MAAREPKLPKLMAQKVCSRTGRCGLSGRRPATWRRQVGVQRGTRAPVQSAHPPSWLTVVGWGSCHNRARCRGQPRSTPVPCSRVAARFLGWRSRSSARRSPSLSPKVVVGSGLRPYIRRPLEVSPRQCALHWQDGAMVRRPYPTYRDQTYPATAAVWRALRELRPEPPGYAGKGPRQKLFSAALEQSEQLFTAAASVGPASRPLVLFYGLSQAGRAIAACAPVPLARKPSRPREPAGP